MSYLLDTNVWLALAIGSHSKHTDARTWFDGLTSSDVCYFCRQTQQAFLRLASNPKIFGNHALSLADAWVAFDTLMSDPRTAYADEPQGIEMEWRKHTQSRLIFHEHVERPLPGRILGSGGLGDGDVRSRLRPIQIDRMHDPALSGLRKTLPAER